MLHLTTCGGFRPEQPSIRHVDWLRQRSCLLAASAPNESHIPLGGRAEEPQTRVGFHGDTLSRQSRNEAHGERQE